MPSTTTGYGNGTMYAQAGGTTFKFRQPASHGLTAVATTNVQQPGTAGAAVVWFNWSSLTWCKNILAMFFPFFDKSLSTPYSGQIFPTGVSVGNAGQVFPTKG